MRDKVAGPDGPDTAEAKLRLFGAARARTRPRARQVRTRLRVWSIQITAQAARARGARIAITGSLAGLIADAILIGAGGATATPAGFARLAAGAPAVQLGRTMGTAAAGRGLGDAGGPVLVGAFGLISLTSGLAALLVCAALAAPRNHTGAPRPVAGGS